MSSSPQIEGKEAMASEEGDGGGYLQVDLPTYLGIDENGDYFISYKPQKLPQGIRVQPLEINSIGLRKFEIYKEGADTFDFVAIGVIMVGEDGIAWIAGATKEPTYNGYNEILLPPVVVKIPVKKPDNLTEAQLRTQLQIELMKKLDVGLTKAGYDKAELIKAGYYDSDEADDSDYYGFLYDKAELIQAGYYD